MAKKLSRIMPALSEGTTAALADAVRQLRDAKQRISDLEGQLSEAKEQTRAMERERLPDMFRVAGVVKFGLSAEGNNPALEASLKPFYRANIAADWDDDRRTRAFAELERCGGADLVRYAVTVDFPRGAEHQLGELTDWLRSNGFNFGVRPSVPWNTLSAWLREQVEVHRRVPQLDLIGGDVGTIVKIKETKWCQKIRK